MSDQEEKKVRRIKRAKTPAQLESFKKHCFTARMKNVEEKRKMKAAEKAGMKKDNDIVKKEDNIKNDIHTDYEILESDDFDDETPPQKNVKKQPVQKIPASDTQTGNMERLLQLLTINNNKKRSMNDEDDMYANDRKKNYSTASYNSPNYNSYDSTASYNAPNYISYDNGYNNPFGYQQTSRRISKPKRLAQFSQNNTPQQQHSEISFFRD